MKKTILAAAMTMIMVSCIKEPEVNTPQENQQISQSFDFKSTGTVNIDMTFTDNTGSPIKGVVVELLDNSIEGEERVIFKSLTDPNGTIQERIELPSFLSEVVLEANYIGIPNDLILPVHNGAINFDYTGEVDPSQVLEVNSSSTGQSNQQNQWTNVVQNDNGINVIYSSTYDRNGVPDNLEEVRDEISATLLEYINASLPEAQPVPQYHPSYIAEGKKTTLDIVKTADVWVTFVHEGAGWRNAIGFYTYPTGTPPQSLDDISDVNIIFPNLSYRGSGGRLTSGDKINIGRFDAGVTIGLVLLSDGWDGKNSEDYQYMVFADKQINPEPNDDLKQHNVLLWDAENELFLLGFEDVRRDDIPFKCDQDFNDAILFVTSNPVEAISTINVSPVDKPGTLDNDGDGVNDILDEYPNDPTRAYDSYYPSATTYGTFAFEDNWPDYGDYDFNDLVIDYQFKHCLNADNKVVQIIPKFKIGAIGAGYRNGFGIATDLNVSDIVSVQGHSLNAGYIQTNANGTEANQSKAVIVVSDNLHDHFSSNGFVNTEDESSKLDPQTVTLDILLSTPKSYAEIGSVPYNPFLIISQNRGREVHLPGYQPTDLVDADFFGTLDDDSDPERGIYYRSKTDLPWGIHLPESFCYPKEKVDIRNGHLRFTDWARSSGFSYMDWYRDVSGYRNKSHLYLK